MDDEQVPATLQFQRAILERYPYPIARAYQRVYRASEPVSQHQLVLSLFETILKYLAAISIGQYRRDCLNDQSRANTKLDQLLAALSRPSLGDWNAFTRDILASYAKSRQGDLLVLPEVIDFYTRSVPGEQYPAMLACFNKIRASFTPNEGGNAGTISFGALTQKLVTYRNRVAHGAPMTNPRVCGEWVAAILPALEEALLAAQFLAGAGLIYVQDVRITTRREIEHVLKNYTSVADALPMPPYIAADIGQALDPQRLYISRADVFPRPLLTLHPFLLVGLCERSGEAQLFLLNQADPKRIEYRCTHCDWVYLPDRIRQDFEWLFHGPARAERPNVAVAMGEERASESPATAGPATPAAHAAPVVHHTAQPISTVPAPVADFTGRATELEELETYLTAAGAHAPVVLICGMAGAGKTQMALMLAQRITPVYPDAQLIFELQQGDQPQTAEAILGAIILALHPTEELPDRWQELQALYRSTLEGRRGVIVLDNALDAQQIQPLLPPPPGWAMLITSRRRFPLPNARLHPLNVLTETESAGLLTRLLQDGGRGDLLEHPGLNHLIARCGQLPLALRLAAAYLTTYFDWSLDEYLDHLASDLLAGLNTERDGIGQVLESSIRRLVGEDLELAQRWRSLATFAGAFDRAATAAIWNTTETDARASLSALCQRSLLDYDRGSGTYRLHDLLRAYALTPTAEQTIPATNPALRLDETRRLHANYYLSCGARAEQLYKKGGVTVLDALHNFDAVWPNLYAAWEWRSTQHDPAAWRYLTTFHVALPRLINLRLPPRQRIPIIEAALSAAQHLDEQRAQNIHLGNLGLAYAALGDFPRAIKYYEQNLALARKLGNRSSEQVVLGNLGRAYHATGQYDRALAYHEQNLARARELKNPRGLAVALTNMAMTKVVVGEPQQALELTAEAIELYRQIGERRGECTALNERGNASLALGAIEQAIESYEQALGIAREMRDRSSEANSCWNLGLAYAKRGDYARAAEMMQVRVAYRQSIGHPDADKEARLMAEMQAKASQVGAVRTAE